MLLCLTAGYAQKECDRGNKGPNQNPPQYQGLLYDTFASVGTIIAHNEIIGSIGYDSIHWVSVKDVLNYTILFENDPEYATANE